MTQEPTPIPGRPAVAHRIVDAHTHLLPDRLALAIRSYFEERICSHLAYPPLSDASRAELRDRGVARCWTLPYAHRKDVASKFNRWAAETFASDPLVVPGATVHPEDSVSHVLDEALGELRLPLVKLHCSVGNFPADDPRLDPLWKRVSAEGRPVVVHAGRAVAGTTAEADIDCIARVAERWPDAKLIVAHCGSPAVSATLKLLRTSRSVYADLAPVVRDPIPLRADDIAGIEHRILFGSDMPNVAVRLEAGISQVMGWNLPDAACAAILGETADSLIGHLWPSRPAPQHDR